MGFQTEQHDLTDLLKQTRSGAMQLPDFQRGYVWDDERVRQLLVTIAVSHPLGVILTLDTGNSEIHFQSRPIQGVEPAEAREPDHLVLDGQQRLTSLTQALTGTGIVTTADNGERRYFIDIPAALADPDHLGDAFRSLPATGKLLTNFNRDVALDISTRAKEIEAGYLPVSIILSDDAFQWVFDWGNSCGRNSDVTTVLRTVVEPMRRYKIPSIRLDKSTTMDAVTTVFENVNQGGVKLTVFELLTAKFAGDGAYFAEHGRAFTLREDWDHTRAVLDQHPVLEGFWNDAFLQCVTLVATHASTKATSGRKEDVLRLSLADYMAWAPKVRDALVWSARFLDGQHIHVAKYLPYPKQLVPLAALRVVLGPQADAHGVHDRLSQWFWCGILGELYGSASETRFARDLDQVPAWARREEGAVSPRTVDDAFFNETRLHSLRRRNSAAYKGIYALLMAQDAKDWVFNQSFDRADYLELKVEIHHIFPKAWCDRNEIPYWQKESIVNKTPLADKTNNKLSGNAPSAYRATIRREIKADDSIVDSVIATHLIEPSLLWADDFDAFFVARRNALCALVESAMGKPVNRDVEVENDESTDVLSASLPVERPSTEPDDEEAL